MEDTIFLLLKITIKTTHKDIHEARKHTIDTVCENGISSSSGGTEGDSHEDVYCEFSNSQGRAKQDFCNVKATFRHQQVNGFDGKLDSYIMSFLKGVRPIIV